MTDKYAVIGNPIAHSKSPQIHKMFAEQTGQDISYEAILAPLDGFAATVKLLQSEGYKGCNITVPFKFEAFKLSTQLSHQADIAQSVNTLKLNFDSDVIFGDNTDGTGLVNDFRFNLGVTLNNARVLLMGAGGAASGIVQPLGQQGAIITIANRTADKARVLASTPPFIKPNPQYDSARKNYTGSLRGCGYDELTNQQFDVVINATSTGLSDEMPPLPPGIFAPGALAYDLMYGRETPFMKFALAQGVSKDRITDGLGMLVEQAAESFFIWRGVRRKTTPVIAALRNQQ